MKHAIQDIRNAHELHHVDRRVATGDHLPSRRAGTGARFLSRAGADFRHQHARHGELARGGPRGESSLHHRRRHDRQMLRERWCCARQYARTSRKPIRSAGTIPTARARPRRRSSSRHIAIRFSRTAPTSRSPPRARAMSSAAAIGPRTASCPTAIRALSAGQPIPVRNPDFTRPWQHVLEPLGGYLLLGAKLEQARHAKIAGANRALRPSLQFRARSPSANRPVREVGGGNPQALARHVGAGRAGKAPQGSAAAQPRHRQGATTLGWTPRWDFARTVAETVAWYRSSHSGACSMLEFTKKQIEAYLFSL